MDLFTGLLGSPLTSGYGLLSFAVSHFALFFSSLDIP